MVMPGQLLEFSDVLLNPMHMEIFSIQPVVSLMQGYAVIVYLTRQVDLLVQMPVFVGGVEFEGIGFHAMIIEKYYTNIKYYAFHPTTEVVGFLAGRS